MQSIRITTSVHDSTCLLVYNFHLIFHHHIGNIFFIEAIVIANAIRYVGCLILVVFLLRNKLK